MRLRSRCATGPRPLRLRVHGALQTQRQVVKKKLTTGRMRWLMPRRWSRSSDRGRRAISGAQFVRAMSADHLTCRKARALVGLSRLEEARDALVDGLQFEPNDKVSRLAMGNSASASADPAGVERFPQGDRRKDCRGRRLDQLYMTARIVTMHSV